LFEGASLLDHAVVHLADNVVQMNWEFNSLFLQFSFGFRK
jgi:hypothetical protein